MNETNGIPQARETDGTDVTNDAVLCRTAVEFSAAAAIC